MIRSESTIKDAQGGIGRPWQRLDTLDRMERAGTISAAQHQAGLTFRDMFNEAGLDPLWAADPTRLSVLAHKGVLGAGRLGNREAAQIIMKALDVLGGVTSPGGSCAWHVLGCEQGLESWALSRHSGTGRVDARMARGILLMDLVLLQKFYGILDN